MALFKGFPSANWLDWYPGQRIKLALFGKPPAQTEPYVSDMVGFNTRFSRFELEQIVYLGRRELTPNEQKFLDYVSNLDD